MKQLTILYIISFLSFGLLGCSSLSPYKVPILQGNIIEEKDVEQLSEGLTKDQVQYLLGTPMLNSPLHPDRWDYIYSVTIGDQLIGEKKLSLIFDDNQKLIDLDLKNLKKKQIKSFLLTFVILNLKLIKLTQILIISSKIKKKNSKWYLKTK